MARSSALIVDADAASSKLLSVVLERAGWLAIVAHSIEAGRRILDLLRLDVVLLEPGPVNGIGVAHLYALRRDHAGVPIVVVSSNSEWSKTDPECAGHIHKPIDVASFVDQLNRILEARR